MRIKEYEGSQVWLTYATKAGKNMVNCKLMFVGQKFIVFNNGANEVVVERQKIVCIEKN